MSDRRSLTCSLFGCLIRLFWPLRFAVDAWSALLPEHAAADDQQDRS